MTESEQPKRGKNDRQKAWKKRSGFEQSEARRAYKREWARAKRQKLKDSKGEGE